MSMFKINKTLAVLGAGLVLFPTQTGAAFNFVVNQGLWLTPGKWFATDSVKVYTVVINNNFEKLSGDVQFFSNGRNIGTISVVNLPFEDAKQVGVELALSAGVNKLEAKLSNVVVQEKSGKITSLTPDQISGLEVQREFTIDVDTDKDDLGDSEDSDDDNDLLSDDQEKLLGTDTKKVDSDGDTLTDKQEVDKKMNPLQADTDGDGLTDGEEVNKYGTDPNSSDTDGDGIPDKKEISLSMNPKEKDTDGDGLGDKEELDKGTNPLKMDSDGDGIKDIDEIKKGTNPIDADADKDGVKDGIDAFPLDKNESKDVDSNGIGDNADAQRLAAATAEQKRLLAEQAAAAQAAAEAAVASTTSGTFPAPLVTETEHSGESQSETSETTVSPDVQIERKWLLGGAVASFIGFLLFSALYAAKKRQSDENWE